MKVVYEITIYELIIPYITTVMIFITGLLYVYMLSKMHDKRYSAMFRVILCMFVWSFCYLLMLHFTLYGRMKLAGNMYAISQIGLTFLMPCSVTYIILLIKIPNQKAIDVVNLISRVLLIIAVASVPFSLASANFDFAILHLGTKELSTNFDSNIPRLAVPEVYFSIRNALYLLIGPGSVVFNLYWCHKMKAGVVPVLLSIAFFIPLVGAALDFFMLNGRSVFLPEEMHFSRVAPALALFSICAFMSSISIFVQEFFSIDVLRSKLAVINVQNNITVEEINKSRAVFIDVRQRLADFVRSLNINAKSIFSSCKISVLYTDSLFEANQKFCAIDEGQLALYSESRRRIDGIYSSFEVLKKAIMGQAGTLDSIVDDISGSSDILSKVEEKISHLRNTSSEVVNSYSQIKQSMIDSFKQLDSIVEISSSVKKSIVFIKDISEKTNTLSVNASIQASKSSIWQDSFSVVANEMEDLAIDSKTAAERIDSLFMLVTQTTNEFIATKNYIIQVFDSIIDNISSTMLKINLISNIVSSQLSDNSTISQNTKFALELNRYIAEEIESRYDEIYEVIQKFDALDEQLEFFRDQLQTQTNEISKLSNDMNDLIVLSQELNTISENITEYTSLIEKEVGALPAS